MTALITSALDVSRYAIGAIAAVVLVVVLLLLGCGVKAGIDAARERQRGR